MDKYKIAEKIIRDNIAIWQDSGHEIIRERLKRLGRTAGGAMLQRPENQLTEGQLLERQRFQALAKVEKVLILLLQFFKYLL